MDRCAQELKLSCDEVVLLRCGQEQRLAAALILNTAASARGFTSCLSSSAASLRYRLRSIADPPRRKTGALMVGVATFLSHLTIGMIRFRIQ